MCQVGQVCQGKATMTDKEKPNFILGKVKAFAMKTRKEADIKRAITQYLRARGCLVIPYRNVGIFKRVTGQYISSPHLGISDLLGLTREGRFFAIEVKRPGNRPTLFQEQFLETVRSFNCIAIVAYSIDDCIEAGL